MNTATIHAEIELIGYTSKGVILNLGDDRGMTVGRVIDPLKLLQSALFERLGCRDRRLIVQLVATQS
jgi:PhoPQ-activated pathogenicity-related protein